MRYTDSQRLERMISTARKLLDYIDGNKITQDEILDQEPLRWAITTPLYNIGGQAYKPERRIQGSLRRYSVEQDFRFAASPGARL